MNWYRIASNQHELESLGYTFNVVNRLPLDFAIDVVFNKLTVGHSLFTQEEGIVRLDNPNWDAVWNDSDKLKPHQMWVLMVEVDPEHQRKGIASAMYDLAEKITGNKIVRTSSRTPESDALWTSRNRKKI